MRLTASILATALLLPSLLVTSRALADYPIVSQRYLADPGSLVYDGRIYLYNSNDDDNTGASYTMHSIVCVSTADLKNWTDHGIVFSVPADASWASNSWAPQPITRDGKIYLYFGNSGSGVGVASSSNPISGFKDAKGSYLVSSSTPGASGDSSWLFDPGALIDDDGTAYLSFGGNGENNARIIKLGADLVSVSGSAAALSPKGFFEASFLFKHNKVYYMAYSSNPANGLRIDYLKSTSPMSGYTYGGIVGDQPPENGDNNHASEFQFKDKWYHAYHNRSVAKKAGISATYKRNLAIEELEFNADDTIKQVKYTTDGVTQVGTLNPYLRVEAETTNAQSGIKTETCSEGGMDVTQIATGDWVRVRGVDFGSAGAKSFKARVASTGTGSIELRLGTETGTLIGTCPVTATGGAQMWADTTCDVTGATGVKDLYLKFTGTFNFNYWQFTSVDGSTGGGGAGGMSGTGGGNPGAGGASAGGASAGGRAGAGTTGGSGNSAGSGTAGATTGAAGAATSVGGAAGQASAAGGAATGTAGAGLPSAAGAPSGSDPGSTQSGGCGCAVIGADSPSRHAPLALLVASLLVASRRRRSRVARSQS